MKTHNLSALKTGTRIVGATAHLDTKFDWNTVNTRKVMCDYSQKITPICCHIHRVKHAWYEAENWHRGRLPIKPQTFCGLKEMELKIIKIIIAKKPTVCNNNVIEN